jgi:hypothetical protein
MRNYWLKIAFGALGVFLVGYVVVAVGRSAKHTVVSTFESTDPISLPIPFVDFKLDGRKMGEVSRVVLLRNEPSHIASVTVVLKMADSLRPDLQHCILTVDNVDRLNENSTFRCQNSSDTAGLTLVPFGRVAFKGGSTDTLPLLLPAKAVADIQRISFRLNEHGVSISDEADSIRGVNDSIQEYRDSVREAIHDSLSAAMERRSDSLESATDRLADSLTEAALRKAQPKAAPAPTRPHVTPKPAAKPAAPPGTSVTPR